MTLEKGSLQIYLRTLKRDHPGLGRALNPVKTSCKRREGETDTEIQEEEHVNEEADFGIVLSQTMEYLEPKPAEGK